MMLMEIRSLPFWYSPITFSLHKPPLGTTLGISTEFHPFIYPTVGFLLVLMQLFLPWFWQVCVSFKWINVPYLCQGDKCTCSSASPVPVALGRVRLTPSSGLTGDFAHFPARLQEQLAGMCRFRPLISSQTPPWALSWRAVFHSKCSESQLLLFVWIELCGTFISRLSPCSIFIFQQSVKTPSVFMTCSLINLS